MTRRSFLGLYGRGFSLLELLVVTAIIAVLIALLAPAIQTGREAARRSTCASHLRQVGLALLNYNDSQRRLPTGAKNAKGNTLGVSWWIGVLPFLDAPEIYSGFDTKASHSGAVLLHSHNANLIDGFETDLMFCPSSTIPKLEQIGNYQIAMPSYVGIAGASSHDDFPEERTSTCCSPKNQGEISAGGLLIANSAVRWRQITDGASRTLVVGEASEYIYDRIGTPQRIDGGVVKGWPAGTSAAGTPPTYDARTPPSWNVTTIRYPPNTTDYTLPGIDNNRGANNPLISPHAGGVNCLFADGSVRSVPNEVDIVCFKQLATRDDGSF